MKRDGFRTAFMLGLYGRGFSKMLDRGQLYREGWLEKFGFRLGWEVANLLMRIPLHVSIRGAGTKSSIEIQKGSIKFVEEEKET